ncbi:MAG: hypothetical protein Q7R97_05015 [Candidatus Daviesbacteria bacterium]|nr:hypothetical protein [Candidatus Daviesbacteria bacterium]
MPKKIVKSKAIAEVSSSQTAGNLPGLLKNLKLNKFVIIAIVIIGLALIFTNKKNWIVAGTVNGESISNFEVLSRLNKEYRSAILTEIINEKIALQELKKNNQAITAKDIDDKIANLEQINGGKEAFDAKLAQSGYTREGIRTQLIIPIMAEKLYANEATVSATEVADFIAQVTQGQGKFQATDSAGIQLEAENALKQQKLQALLEQKFPELKSSAKVSIF